MFKNIIQTNWLTIVNLYLFTFVNLYLFTNTLKESNHNIKITSS